jgi:hypothetical protein
MDALYSELDALDYWRLCDQLTVTQAALLLVGKDPTDLQYSVRSSRKTPIGFDAAFAALTSAIKAKRLPEHFAEGADVTNWYNATISVEDLTAWLKTRGINRRFFFPATEAGPDYLSKDHPNYSMKLAAAIMAWKAVSADEELRRGKSVKQALAGVSGGESDEIVPIVRRDTRMASTGQQNAAGLGAGISDVRVLRTSLRAKKAIEIVAWWRGRSP